MTTATHSKSERIDVRASAPVKQLLQEAARVSPMIDVLRWARREVVDPCRVLLIFCSDNRPEFRAPWRGTTGPWRGTHHTAMEGSLRVPFIARWKDHIAPGWVSNEMVHITDLFATLTALARRRCLRTGRSTAWTRPQKPQSPAAARIFFKR